MNDASQAPQEMCAAGAEHLLQGAAAKVLRYFGPRAGSAACRMLNKTRLCSGLQSRDSIGICLAPVKQ